MRKIMRKRRSRKAFTCPLWTYFGLDLPPRTKPPKGLAPYPFAGPIS
jgi:hypothetical protein